MLLSELVERLAEDVPAEDGVPSVTQYQNAVRDAIRDFSERCGLEQVSTIQIVSGTATYDLPSDFVSLISFPKFASFGGVIHTEEGMIPIGDATLWVERHSIRNGQITLFPVPRYRLLRQIRYKAAWIATAIEGDSGDEDFETLGEREARIVLLKAKSIAMNKLSNAQAGSAIKYSFGAVSEELDGGAESTQSTAELMENEYLEACKLYNGQYVSYGD